MDILKDLSKYGVDNIRSDSTMRLSDILVSSMRFLYTMKRVLDNRRSDELEEELPTPAAIQTWLDEVFDNRPVDWFGVYGLNIFMTGTLDKRCLTSMTEDSLRGELPVFFLLCLRGAVIQALKLIGWPLDENSVHMENMSQVVLETGIMEPLIPELSDLTELTDFLLGGANELQHTAEGTEEDTAKTEEGATEDEGDA